MYKPSKDRSIEVKLLYAAMSKKKIGELAAWEVLEKELGKPRGEIRSFLPAALQQLAENGFHFKNKWNEGYERIDDKGKVDFTSTRYRKRVRRETKRTKRDFATVNLSKLDDRSLNKLHTAMTITHATEILTRPNNIKKLEAKIEVNENKPLLIDDALEIFRKGK